MKIVKYVKIKSVEICGMSDVYNMEVEGHHNFSVNGGLIVHNCYDALGYGLISRHAPLSTVRKKEEKTRAQKHKEKLLRESNRKRYRYG
jgi:hypothetical protein